MHIADRFTNALIATPPNSSDRAELMTEFKEHFVSVLGSDDMGGYLIVFSDRSAALCPTDGDEAWTTDDLTSSSDEFKLKIPKPIIIQMAMEIMHKEIENAEKNAEEGDD